MNCATTNNKRAYKSIGAMNCSTQNQQAACDGRHGMSWKALHLKYGVTINTLRSTLADYSDEFNPCPH